MSRSAKKKVKLLRDVFNGVAFGITETVPGVSGGTIAIILGFYDELIESINNFTKNNKKYLRFLLPLLLGAAIGLLSFSSLINYLLTHYSFPTMAFFIGLVTGIIPLIYSKAKTGGNRFMLKELALIAVPVILLIVITNLKGVTLTNPAEIVNNADITLMIFVFFGGVIAAAALIIPGVSGSFVLLLLGIYPVVTYSLASVSVLMTDITNIALLINICKILAPLAAGIIIGGLSMAKLIEKLLSRYYRKVYLIILGLLLGSVYALFREPLVYRSSMTPQIIILGIVTILAGCVISYKLGRNRL